VTHNLKDAVKYGERIIILKDGSISQDIGKHTKINVTGTNLFELI